MAGLEELVLVRLQLVYVITSNLEIKKCVNIEN